MDEESGFRRGPIPDVVAWNRLFVVSDWFPRKVLSHRGPRGRHACAGVCVRGEADFSKIIW